MPLYTFKCPHCGTVKEALVRAGARFYDCPNCKVLVKDGAVVLGEAPSLMHVVLSTPSAPQWKCSTAHSRSKGF